MEHGYSPDDADIAWACDIANMAQAHRKWGVYAATGSLDTAGKIIEAASPSLVVKTSANMFYVVDGQGYYLAAAANTTLDAYSAERYDIVYVNSSGLQNEAGSTTAPLRPPDLPDNSVLLAVVHVQSGTIVNSNIADSRLLMAPPYKWVVDSARTKNDGTFSTLLQAVSVATTVGGENTIMLSPGNHTPASKLTIPTLTKIFGAGRYLTTITHNFSDTLMDLGGTGIELADFSIDGNDSTNNGIDLKNSSNVIIRNVKIYDYGAGSTGYPIFRTDAVSGALDNISIKNCEIITINADYAINLEYQDTLTNLRIEDCTIKGTAAGQSLIYLERITCGWIKDCNLLSYDETITIEHCRNFNISGNYLGPNTGANQHHMLLQTNCSRLVVSNNTLDAPRGVGIYINGADDSVVSGNQIHGSLGAGATGSGIRNIGERNVMIGNMINGTVSYGLFSNSNYSSITGNVIMNASDHGVYLLGDFNTVAGNIVEGDNTSGKSGFFVESAEHNTFTGNVTTAFHTNGYIEDASNCENNVIIGNNFAGNGVTFDATSKFETAASDKYNIE